MRHAKIRVGPPTTALGDAGNTATQLWRPGRAGVVQFIGIDYNGTVNAERDLVIKRDSSAGTTVYTRSNSETDLALTPIGSPGAVDEAQAATDAADARSGGVFFTSGLHLSLAQLDDDLYADVTFLWKPLRKKNITLTTDGSGDATGKWVPNRPYIVRAIQVDYSASAGSSMTMTMNTEAADGTQVFAKGSAETDFGPVAIGTPGTDEAGNALAATDGSPEGGLAFVHGLYFTIASGGATKTNVVSLWYE